RATFPSDTISTHLIHPPGVARLRRWGVLDRLVATGCPPIHTYIMDMGPFAISGSPGTHDEPVAYAPRRTVLDKLLVDSAGRAGAEVREGFTVDAVVFDGDRVAGIRGHAKRGQAVTERARVVVGADGLQSVVARQVAPPEYDTKPALQAGYYTYWSGLPMRGCFEGYDRGDRTWAAWPTNDDLTLVVVGWPIGQFEANKADIERHYLQAFERAPAFRERVAAATRVERFAGLAVPNFFRKPFGPGWALVGDAGYNKDFITAQGINDAFRDAEVCANALHETFAGVRSFDDAMAAYQAARDEQVRGIYQFTCDFASYTPPPPERLQLLAAVHGNQDAMDGFVRIIAGVVQPTDFFSPGNVGRIMAAAQGPGRLPSPQA
ncbi:MAG: NAD(P)/FAD-dependent oxidoreductase, partial [Bacteroidales bacterium]